MFKWRRRRSKGNQGDRDLEEAARILEDAEFRSFLDGPGRPAGSHGSDGDGGTDGGNSPEPPVTSLDASPDDDSD